LIFRSSDSQNDLDRQLNGAPVRTNQKIVEAVRTNQKIIEPVPTNQKIGHVIRKQICSDIYTFSDMDRSNRLPNPNRVTLTLT
jgi:hypothetical protein